jgi:hypothetical protein
MQHALNQKRAEQHAPATPIRDATITPHANTRTGNAYLVMEAPPQWRECDGFIYCRVNVAKMLIARLMRTFAMTRAKHACRGAVQIAATALSRRDR